MVSCVSDFEKGPPSRIIYDFEKLPYSINLEPGQEYYLSTRIGDDLTAYFKLLGTTGPYLSHQKVGHVYFWGCIPYSDDRGVIRNVAFCRHYETDSGKFAAIDDHDYEYAD